MSELEYQYEITHVFDQEKGQTGQPTYSCNVPLFFVAAMFLLLLQGKDH